MASTIITKNSSTASAVPVVGDLTKGELAVNVTDKKIYTKDNSAAVVKLVGSLGNQEANAVAITGGSIAGITDLAVADGGTGASTASDARTNLGLGSIATQAASSVTITGGSVTGITDITVADGGTGASTAANARTNLGAAASGANSDITSLSGLTTALSVAQGGTGITSFGSGVATFLGTPSSANLLAAVTDETGTGALVFANTPTLVAPILGTPTSGNFTTGSFTWPTFNQNTTGTAAGLSATLAIASGGTGATTAGGALTSLGAYAASNPSGYTTNTGTVTSVGGTGTVNGISLSGTVTTSGNLTLGGTLSGVSLTSQVSGTLPTANGGTNLTSFTSGGVVYASSTSALATGSALVFDGTTFTAPKTVISLSAGSTDSGSTNSALYLNVGTPTTTANLIRFAGAVSSDIYFGRTVNADAFAWGLVNSTEYMRLTSTGLGIGTSSPGARLDVSGGTTRLTSGGTGGLFGSDNASYLGLFASATANAAAIYMNGQARSGFESQLQYGASAHVFLNETLGSELMRIQNIGNVGIGTSSPAQKLHIEDAGNLTLQLTKAGVASFSLTNNGAAGTVLSVESVPMIFKTSSTERMRITSGGYFKASNTGTYVNSTSSYHEIVTDQSDNFIAYLHNSAASSPYGLEVNFTATPNNATNFYYRFSDGAANRFIAYSNGGLANYSANNVNLSDRREKTNFAPATSYLDKICAIPVQTFNYIDQNLEQDGGLTLGVVAQDVQAIAPELVTETNWGTTEDPKMRLSIYQTDLQYALMKCIQEQQAIIESLKARLDAANL